LKRLNTPHPKTWLLDQHFSLKVKPKNLNALIYLTLLFKILLTKATNLNILLYYSTPLQTFSSYQVRDALHPLFQATSLKLTEKTYQHRSTTVKATTSNPKLVFRLYFLYLRFSYKNTIFFFKPHTNFRLFFNFISRDNVISLNTLRFFNRWSATQSFISNLFFYSFKILTFGNKFVWNEILTLNWLLYKPLPQTTFFPNPSLFIKNFVLTAETEQLFLNLLNQGLEVLFFIDVLKHGNTIFFFKSLKSFVIGLVPININPWEFSYAIPIFNQNLLIQFYFLKLFFNLYYYNQKKRFFWLKHLWVKSLL
jgi:hypothetical protein